MSFNFRDFLKNGESFAIRLTEMFSNFRKMKTRYIYGSENGFTLTELLVVVSLVSVLSGFAFLNTMQLSSPSLNAASEISSFVKKTRAKALASTSAYTITAASTSSLTTTVGTTCAATQTPDSELTLNLENASLTDISWSICFSSRGFPNSNVVIPVSDLYEGANSVEVLLGGAIRIL